MAMLRITPMPVRVRCDWFDVQPRAIEIGDETVPVVSVTQVRAESAAYRVDVGPRTIFEVRTPDARLRLAYEHRRRRWLLEGLDRAPLADVGIRRAA